MRKIAEIFSVIGIERRHGPSKEMLHVCTHLVSVYTGRVGKKALHCNACSARDVNMGSVYRPDYANVDIV